MADEFDPCQVHGAGGELLADGFIREQHGDTVLVEAENFPGGWLQGGDAVSLHVKSAVHGACTYDAVVVSSAARQIGLSDLRLRERVQLRSAVRVGTSLPHVATWLGDGPDGEPVERELDVVVLDVSGTGMRLRCAEELPAGSRLALTFTGGRRPLPVDLVVVRAEGLRGEHAYGCLLVDADERLADELYRFVLGEQRRQLAQRRAWLEARRDGPGGTGSSTAHVS